ncbi:MAG: DUF3782 domain-containing protein [Magnetococcales bacterium]|nr:DUF3782 domain-containing protein [Magnetococcales bacterium]
MSHSVTFEDVWRMFQETDRKIQETAAQMRETDRKIQEVSDQMRETDRKIQETNRQVKAVSKQIGALGSRWGEFVESLVAPACRTLFQERGIPVHTVSHRVKAQWHLDKNFLLSFRWV